MEKQIHPKLDYFLSGTSYQLSLAGNLKISRMDLWYHQTQFHSFLSSNLLWERTSIISHKTGLSSNALRMSKSLKRTTNHYKKCCEIKAHKFFRRFNLWGTGAISSLVGVFRHMITSRIISSSISNCKHPHGFNISYRPLIKIQGLETYANFKGIFRRIF